MATFLLVMFLTQMGNHLLRANLPGSSSWIRMFPLSSTQMRIAFQSTRPQIFVETARSQGRMFGIEMGKQKRNSLANLHLKKTLGNTKSLKLRPFSAQKLLDKLRHIVTGKQVKSEEGSKEQQIHVTVRPGFLRHFLLTSHSCYGTVNKNGNAPVWQGKKKVYRKMTKCLRRVKIMFLHIFHYISILIQAQIVRFSW